MKNGFKVIKFKIKDYLQEPGKIYLIVMVSLLIFLIGTSISMIFYGGGHFCDPSNPGYSFSYNYFSDLGTSVSWTGKSNMISMIIFMISICCLGIGMILFFMVLPQNIKKVKLAKKFSKLGSIQGILSGTCAIGVGFAPGDLMPLWHGIIAIFLYIFLAGASIFFGIAFLKEKSIPKLNSFIFLVFGVFTVLLIVIVLFGCSTDPCVNHVCGAIMQKITMYLWIATYLFEANYLKKMVKISRHSREEP